MYERPEAISQRRDSKRRVLSPIYYPIDNSDHHSALSGYLPNRLFISLMRPFIVKLRSSHAH